MRWDRNTAQQSRAPGDDSIRCELCRAHVTFKELATHMESILLDIQRQSEAERERCDALQSEREVVERKEYEAVLAMSLLDTHKNIAQICIKSSLSSSHSRQTSDVKSIISMKLRDNTEHVLKVYME